MRCVIPSNSHQLTLIISSFNMSVSLLAPSRINSTHLLEERWEHTQNHEHDHHTTHPKVFVLVLNP